MSKPRAERLAHAKRRLLAEVRVQDQCLIWTGALLRSGYGSLALRLAGEKRESRAHRVAWIVFRGPIPAGMQVLHRCDTPACVNVEHLFLGTQGDNVFDAIEKGRFRPIDTSPEAQRRRRQLGINAQHGGHS
jgi:hypothetical protein